MQALNTIWSSIFTSSSFDTEKVHYFGQQLYNAYQHSALAYHNWGHIGYMMATYQQFNFNSEELDTLYLAIFFHDVVYDPTRKDNELKSAQWAEKVLNALQFDPRKIERCVQHILATEKHGPSDQLDTQILLDLDLAILGSDRNTYAHYAQCVRKEYAMYSDTIYRNGRIQALEHLLDLPQLFQTDQGKENFQEQAIKNLNWELTHWKLNTTISSCPK